MATADPPEPPSTSYLIARIRDGDRESLETLFARSYHRLERVVRIRTGAASQPDFDLADLVQEAFLKAWRGLDGYAKDPEHGFLDWVARIAENALADQVRRQGAAKRDRRREQPQPSGFGGQPMELDELVASPDKGPRQWAEQQEAIRRLDACMARLPETEREVLILRYYLEESWEEVGQHIDRTAKGAEQLARRARQRLAECTRHGDEEDGRS